MLSISSTTWRTSTDRYVGNYDKFEEVYAVKKAQLEAAYRKQQQEISELKDFVARNKARYPPATWRCRGRKKLDKMDVIELCGGAPEAGVSPSRWDARPADIFLRRRIW